MIPFNELKRWIGPAIFTILIVMLYQIFAAPILKDILDDWNFLHVARQQAIIQAQQKAEQK